MNNLTIREVRGRKSRAKLVTMSVTIPSTPLIEPDPLLGAPLAHYPSERGRPLIAAAIVIGAAAVGLNFTLATGPAWWGPAPDSLPSDQKTMLGWLRSRRTMRAARAR